MLLLWFHVLTREHHHKADRDHCNKNLYFSRLHSSTNSVIYVGNYSCLKAETQDPTNHCDKSGRQVPSSALILRQVAEIRHLFGAHNRFWKRGNVTSSNLTWRETNWCFLIGWFKFCPSNLLQMCTHGATRLLAFILSLQYVARNQTSLTSCDRSQWQNSVAATKIFTCHTRRFVAATCRGNVSQWSVASCVSA